MELPACHRTTSPAVPVSNRDDGNDDGSVRRGVRRNVGAKIRRDARVRRFSRVGAKFRNRVIAGVTSGRHVRRDGEAIRRPRVVRHACPPAAHRGEAHHDPHPHLYSTRRPEAVMDQKLNVVDVLKVESGNVVEPKNVASQKRPAAEVLVPILIDAPIKLDSGLVSLLTASPTVAILQSREKAPSKSWFVTIMSPTARTCKERRFV